MVFGVVEGGRGRHRPDDELARVLLTVAIDVDVEPLFGDVVCRRLTPLSVVVVPDDLVPAAVMSVLKLDDEARHLDTVDVTNDGGLHSLDAQTGEAEWTTTLTDSAVQTMPPPSVGDVDGDGEPELVAVAHDGIVSLVDPRTGAISSTYEREDVIFTTSTLADVDGDGDVEVFVLYGRGRVVAFDVATG